MFCVMETLCDVYVICQEYHYVSVLDGPLVLACLFLYLLYCLSFVCFISFFFFFFFFFVRNL